MTEIDRPLKVGEVLAETIRLYGERIRASLGLGALFALAFLLARELPVVASVAVVSLAFTAGYAAAARLVSGDTFAAAWAQVGLRVPVLLMLTFVVSLPFALGRVDPLLLLFAVGWLALTGFSIPVTMLERDPAEERRLGRLGYALRRSVTLARAAYLHALGVTVALVAIYVVAGIVLALALVGFAENGRVAALALVQVVLAPFFFIGLSVLYFELRARALSSRRQET